MKTADAIPQRKLAGIKIPVDHGGRSNLGAQLQSPIHMHERATIPVEAPHSSTQDDLEEGVAVVEAAYD